MIKNLLFLLFFSHSLISQIVIKNDISIICNKQVNTLPDSLNNKKKMEASHNHNINKFNPIYGALKLSMLVYQRVISPQLSSDCVFEQSCSNYSKSAIKHCGVIKGVLLTADRLTRCIPATENETEIYLFNEQGKIVDSPTFYSLKKVKK